MIEVPARLALLFVDRGAAGAAALRHALAGIGHTVTDVADLRDALVRCDTIAHDAAIIDAAGGGAGPALAFVRRLRATGRTLPIVILGAPDRPGDAIAMLDAGADDHVGATTSADEIDARLHALVRGRGWARLGDDTLTVGALTISPVRHLAWCDGVVLPLARIEFRLLFALARAAGTVLTRAALVEQVWGTTAEPASNIVDAQVRTLRGKLAAAGAAPVIETVRGVGYRLRR